MPTHPNVHIYITQEPKMTDLQSLIEDVPTSQHEDANGAPIVLFNPYLRRESFRGHQIIVPIAFLENGGVRVVNLTESEDSSLAVGYRLESRWMVSTYGTLSPAQKDLLIKAMSRVANHHANTAQTYLAQNEAAQTKHKDDVEKIGTRLLEEANSRRWCSDYDDIVEELNEDLTVPLPRRKRTYEVEVELIYRVTVEVEAPSEDEARSEVQDDWELAWSQVERDEPRECNVCSVEQA